MKRKLAAILVVIALMLTGFQPTATAAAPQRYIVRTNGGLLSVLNLCNLLGCQVQGSLDGQVGQTYLVTSATNLLSGLLSFVEQLLGIVSVEADQLLSLPDVQASSGSVSGLYDTTPVNYYGTPVWHGYVAQPAAQIIRLAEAQGQFNVSGGGVVAVIDTGVDPNHPVLYPVLLPGYDFTRNQAGASEWPDITSNPPTDTGSGPTGTTEQRGPTTFAPNQSTAAVLDCNNCSDFGHGTMTSGLVHLVAPNARILPLKAFSANGTGYLSNIISALYYGVQHNANVVNMSFDLTASSPALSQAVSYANQAGVVLVASAGNQNTNVAVYPAAMNNQVVGIASTSNTDVKSSFSNYGALDVWIAAPGENVISTYPGGTYGSASGTSFSSPLVAGTVSLMLSATQQPLSQSQAASALAHAQVLTPNLNKGRLDVYQALAAWLFQ
jgi:subtilisin family serine protease